MRPNQTEGMSAENLEDQPMAKELDRKELIELVRSIQSNILDLIEMEEIREDADTITGTESVILETRDMVGQLLQLLELQT
jgi:hypothetical protein